MKSPMNCLIFLMCTALIVGGCGSPQEETARVFRFRLGSDPPSLDPIHCTDTSSGSVVFRMFEGLVEQDPVTLEIVPSLAESWEISDDGLTYTFHLKKGVRFHNGRALTSGDFRWNFERCLTPENISERSWVLAPIKGASEMLEGKATSLSGMETPDDYTVILRLEKPFTPFIAYLSMEAGRVAAREGVDGDRFTPFGTGPFKYISWEHDIRVSLEANHDWHGGEVGIERLDFEVIPDQGVAFQKFVAGELDLVNEIPPGQFRLIQEKYPDSVRMWTYLRNEYIGFNHTRPPFRDNLKLRQAFCRAVDRESIAKNLFEGAALPANSILPPGIRGKDDTIEGYGYDLDKAKQLLAEAGYPGGKGLSELTLWYNANEMHQQVAQIIQADLRKIGVTIRLKSLDWPAYLKACQSFEPDLYRMGWVADIADADNFLYILLDSKQRGAPGNYSGYSNPEFDRLVEEARVVLDENRRVELYKKADRLATEDACWIMLTYTKLRMLFNPDYDGLVYPLQGELKIPMERLHYRPKK